MGDAVYTLSDKRSVARIGAGETFTSDFLTIPVPSNVPDDVIIRLEISHVYYHQDQATQADTVVLAPPGPPHQPGGQFDLGDGVVEVAHVHQPAGLLGQYIGITTPEGRITLTGARTEVFNYFPGWELFWFTLDSPYHGKGIGALRDTVHARLRRRDDVEHFQLGGEGAGGWGATLVRLRSSGR